MNDKLNLNIISISFLKQKKVRNFYDKLVFDQNDFFILL